MIVIKIVDGAYVEARGGLRVNRICGAEGDRRRLVEDFAADGELLRNLTLQQPAEEPVVAICGAVAVIDPVTAAAVGGPLAETFLNPERKIRPHIASAEPAIHVAGRKLDERINADHRPPIVLVFVNDAVFEAEFGVAVAIAAGLCVERQRRNYVRLSIGDDAVIVLPGRTLALRIAADRSAERKVVELKMLVRHRLGVIGDVWGARVGAGPLARVE